MNILQKWFNIIFKRTPPISDCVRVEVGSDIDPVEQQTWSDQPGASEWAKLIYRLDDFSKLPKEFKPITEPTKVKETRAFNPSNPSEFEYNFSNGLVLFIVKSNVAWMSERDCRIGVIDHVEKIRLNKVALDFEKVVDKTVGPNLVGWRDKRWSFHEGHYGNIMTLDFNVFKNGEREFYRIKYQLSK